LKDLITSTIQKAKKKHIYLE